LRYDDYFDKIVRELVELTQAYRYYIYNFSWHLNKIWY
jgi:hypothetical protein